MHEFLALVWSPDEVGSTQQALALAEALCRDGTNWRNVTRANGILLFSPRDLASTLPIYNLHDEAGVVLGRLFPKTEQEGEAEPRIDVDESFSKAVVRSRGQHLVDSSWGRYIAFVWDCHRRQHYVLRDPTGGIPCIYTRVSNVYAFMSDMAAYVDLGGEELPR